MSNKTKRKQKKKITWNKQVESFVLVDFSHMKIPCIAVYDHPTDFPDKIIARIWEVEGNIPTNTYAAFDTVEDAERDIRSAGFSTKIPRFKGDDIAIVGTYFR